VREAKAATFNNTNLDGIDFTGFDFSGSIFTGSPTKWTTPGHQEVVGAGASMNGTKFDGAKLEHVRFIDWDTSAATFVGATKTVWAQGASAVSLAGVPGVEQWSRDQLFHHSMLRGVSVSGAQTPFAGEADAMEGRVDAAAPTAAPVIDQTASLALETLKSINARMREAQTEAPRNEDRILAIV